MEKKTGLELLRVPFLPNQISKLPKGTKAQNECPANEKIKCELCGGCHHPKVIHLDYVGHAALTDRLLDADPLWSWEPLALKDGLPAFDSTGGLWIRLTVCGHTRIGYGHAASSSFKEIGSREKEVIGDALRNAAMRFGAALELWHKGDLHVEEDADKPPEVKPKQEKKPEKKTETKGNQSIITITEISHKDGEKDGKPWRAYYVHGDNGEKYGTFSETFADLATGIMNTGKKAVIGYTVGKFGNNLASIEEASDE